jgi:hypothetical protein
VLERRGPHSLVVAQEQHKNRVRQPEVACNSHVAIVAGTTSDAHLALCVYVHTHSRPLLQHQ